MANENTVTAVLCDDVTEVEALYNSKLVDAKVIPRGGSTLAVDSGKVRALTATIYSSSGANKRICIFEADFLGR